MRIFIHAKDASQKGYHKFLIRTVDTDVVILAVGAMRHLQLEEIWILFGVEKKQDSSQSMNYAPLLDRQSTLSYHCFMH